MEYEYDVKYQDKVKIFSSSSSSELENIVNSFLDENKEIYIENLQYSSQAEHFSVFILYRQMNEADCIFL